jgi:molybdate transport system ATP-binding protein
VPLEQFKRRVGWVAANLQSDHPLTLRVSEVMESGHHASVGLNEPATKAVRALARRTLEEFGLAALEQRTLKELSYGQLRRILFARAFVAKPRLLLLDEPFAGVDRPTRLELRAFVEHAIARGIAVVMSTHHRDEWPAGVTHELELHAGRASYCGEIRERTRRPPKKKTGRQF